MRVLLSLVLILFFGVNYAYSYELSFPKERNFLVKTDYVFFAGKIDKNEEFSINNEKVYIAPNGAFAHSIKLKDGENRIILKSNYNTHLYKVYKESLKTKLNQELIEFDKRLFEVNKDNIPLRSTPVDAGMNRLSHLFKGTKLLLNGEKGDFYRVYLSKDQEAWIGKEFVTACDLIGVPEFITMDNTTYKNASKYHIEFTEKLPYVIEETDEELIFKVYNSMLAGGSVYTINVKKPKKYSYDISLKNGAYFFKISKLPDVKNALEGLTITLDAGHGGTEKGAIGCLGDKEKDLNLKIVNELKEKLIQLGADVVLTRENDKNVALEERVKIAKNNFTNIFISVHLNSIPDVKFNVHKHQGTSVYYYNLNSKILANSIKNSLIDKIKTRDDGTRAASFAVIRPTEYLSVLVEVAYMTNPIDSVLYTKETFASEAADGIIEGLLNFINSK